MSEVRKTAAQKEQERFDKQEARREEAAARRRTPERRTLDGWSKSSVQVGSPAYNRHLNKLEDDVAAAGKEMVFFADNMQEWSNPKTAEAKARKWNDQYCEYMINLCAGPVSMGLTGESVMESIGLCVGMAVVSKDFRSRINAHARNALLPISEKMATNRAAFMDKVCPRGKGEMSRQEEVEGKYEVRRQHYQAALNGGRVPLTEEAVGTKYLGFCQQAYTMMRQDTPDMADLRVQIGDARAKGEDMRAERLQGQLDMLEKQRNESVMNSFNKASSTLQTVAEMDGISQDMFVHGVHKVYGKMVDRHPEMEAMFAETAFGDVDKHYVEVTDKKTGRISHYWDGEFMNKETGEPFRMLMTPRPPYTRSQCVGRIADVYGSIYEKCDTMEDIDRLHQNSQFAMMEPYFYKIAKDDLGHVAVSEKPGSSVEDYLESVLADGHVAAAKRWGDEHEEPARKAAEAKAKADKDAARLEKEERARQREISRDERDAAREQREQEKHEWSRERHEKDMEKMDKQMDSYARQVSRIIKTPAFQEMLAKNLAAGILVNAGHLVDTGAYPGGPNDPNAPDGPEV